METTAAHLTEVETLITKHVREAISVNEYLAYIRSIAEQGIKNPYIGSDVCRQIITIIDDFQKTTQ